ncbi:MAG: hypothetical protein R3Y12_04315 [Clostridia bacterium]
MNIIDILFNKIDVSELILKQENKVKKPSLLGEVINNTENFKLEAFIENNEIIVKIKKKES